jgi:lysozyme
VWINVNRNVTGLIRSRYDALMCAPGRAESRRYSIGNGYFQRFANGGLYLASGRSRPAWSRGRIYKKFVNLGGVRSVLGYPLSDVSPMTAPSGCGSGGCAKEVFAHGNIYLKGTTGAHELHGAVLTYYLGHGGAGGPLGFPTTDVKAVAGGGRTATFEHGTVTCKSSGSCSQS